MVFTVDQVTALKRAVPSRRVKTRINDGKALSYIEGWFAVDQANRIFGFDGWGRETVETRRLFERNHENNCLAVYSAKVRLVVWTNDRTIVRESHGTGEARAKTVGEAHDRALKAAETDATKRALATFGKAFGLALYSGRQSKPECREPRSTQPKDSQSLDSGSLGSGRPSLEPALREDGSGLPSRGKVESKAPSSPIDKSALALSEPKRIRDKDHLRYVAAQPCVLCSVAPCDAHHMRFAQPRAMGRKVSDEFTVPLCRNHHRELHDSGNEAAWWHDMGIDPLEIAKELWAESSQLGGDSHALTKEPLGSSAPTNAT